MYKQRLSASNGYLREIDGWLPVRELEHFCPVDLKTRVRNQARLLTSVERSSIDKAEISLSIANDLGPGWTI